MRSISSYPSECIGRYSVRIIPRISVAMARTFRKLLDIGQIQHHCLRCTSHRKKFVCSSQIALNIVLDVAGILAARARLLCFVVFVVQPHLNSKSLDVQFGSFSIFLSNKSNYDGETAERASSAKQILDPENTSTEHNDRRILHVHTSRSKAELSKPFFGQHPWPDSWRTENRTEFTKCISIHHTKRPNCYAAERRALHCCGGRRICD